MNNPKSISLVFPLYKDKSTIKIMIFKSLKILKKTKKKFEIVIVDDGCPQNSGKIAQLYAKNYSKIRVFLRLETYIEINNVFYISSSKSFKNNFKDYLFENEINFILTFVNIKTGGDFEALGIDEDKKSKQNQEQMTIQQHERWNNKETSGEGLRTNENPYRQNVQRNEHFTGRNEQYEGYNGQRYAKRLPQTNWRQSENWQRGGSCQDLRQRDNDGYQGYQNNPQWENQQDYYQQSQGRGNHERYNNGNRNTTTSWYDEQY